MRLSLILLLMFISTSFACAAPPLIVLLGESTTYGVIATTPPTNFPVTQAMPEPAAVLQALLAAAPPSCPWHNAQVVNGGLPSVSTYSWVTIDNSGHGNIYDWCSLYGPGFSWLSDYACANNLPWGRAVPPASAAAFGRPPDLALIVMGTNDIFHRMSPNDTVTVVRLIEGILGQAGISTRLAPPFHRTDFTPAENAVVQIESIEESKNLLSIHDWLRLPLVSDRLHLTAGGYAAAESLWFDVLCPEP